MDNLSKFRPFVENLRTLKNSTLVDIILEGFKCIYEGSEQSDNLQPDTVLTVYHGTNQNNAEKFLMNGIDATKEVSRSYNQGRERGLYVTDDLATAKSFGNWIFEFEVMGKDLYPTSKWGFGAERKSDSVKKMVKEEYPNSFRPVVSWQLGETREPQAMFLGVIPAGNFKRIHYFNYGEKGQPLKSMNLPEARKEIKVDQNDAEWYDKISDMNNEELLNELVDVHGVTKEKAIDILTKHFDEATESLELPRKKKLSFREYIKSLNESIEYIYHPDKDDPNPFAQSPVIEKAESLFNSFRDRIPQSASLSEQEDDMLKKACKKFKVTPEDIKYDYMVNHTTMTPLQYLNHLLNDTKKSDFKIKVRYVEDDHAYEGKIPAKYRDDKNPDKKKSRNYDNANSM